IGHRRFGPLIRDWRQAGAIARPVKRTALAVMAATPPLSWALGAPLPVLALQIVALAGAAAFVATRPEPRPVVEE
ncbi:DUF454 family protein, partial [Mycobacterium tuberculosis]|nr:DUF454 family protein [Mycobacterium tuberculosis]